MRPASVCLLSAWLLLAGCGYQLVGAGRSLGELGAIAVSTPRNDSAEPGVDYLVADALRRELLRRGGVDLSEEPERADLVVSGSVRPLQVSASSFSAVVLAYEYEVTLTLDLVARRRDGGELPVEARALRESERFLASADAEVQRKNRSEALRRVSRVLATRFFDALAEAGRP